MDRHTVAEALRQIINSVDIPAPSRLLKNVKPEAGAKKLENMPYSMIINLAHAVFWQDLWLSRLKGLKARSITEDWKVPPEEQWKELCERFIAGLQEAHNIAKAKSFKHKMKSDDAACKTLLQIAIHDAYHLGQMALIKRSLRLSKMQEKKKRKT
jgi:uncharacterized damage-inducible protein DinB